MKLKSLRYGVALLVVSLFFTSDLVHGQDESSKAIEVSSEWTVLFDGSSLEGWRAYNGEKLPPGWVVQDNALTFQQDQIGVGDEQYDGSKDLIYGAEEFDNFELYVEWKIPAGGNSGIFYHVQEGYNGPPEVAPEYQLIDDEDYAKLHDLTSYNSKFGAAEPEKLQDWQSTAADYAMYTPDPSKKILHPAGSWNSTRIVFTPERVEHWLNGQMVLSFVPWSDDWNQRRNSGKWENAPDYGKFKTGFIGLQDHGSDLAFRNIKIKRL